MKMIINSGIRKVYYIEDYPDTLSKQLANEAGIECVPVKTLLLAANEKKLE
jgi:deoxycytidylate deaminase